MPCLIFLGVQHLVLVGWNSPLHRDRRTRTSSGPYLVRELLRYAVRFRIAAGMGLSLFPVAVLLLWTRNLGSGRRMDREMLMEHLSQAERHVAEGMMHVEKQRTRVENIARDGHDIGGHEALLRQFEETLRLHTKIRDQLQRQLAQSQ